MIQSLFDNYVFLYAMAGLLGFGVFIKLVINIVYKFLMKASDNMANSKNKLMRSVKMKFEACYKLQIGVNNVDTFVDKYVYKHKFCGIYLYTWENFSGQVLMFCLLTGTVGAGLGLVYDCGKTAILLTFFVGLVSSALLIIIEGFINLPAKRRVIKINMKDYLENLLKVRLEQEYLNPEMLEEYRSEYFNMEEKEASSKKQKKVKNMIKRDKQDDKEDVHALMESLADMAVTKEKQEEEVAIKKATLHRRQNKITNLPNKNNESDSMAEKEEKKKPAKIYDINKKEEKVIEDILKEFMA